MNNGNGLKVKFAVVLLAFFALFSHAAANANPNQYDLSWMDPQNSYPSSGEANQTLGSPARLSAPQTRSSQTGTFGNVSRPTSPQSVALPTYRAVPVQSAVTNILAENSVDNAPIRSGKFDFGFPKTGPAAYRGAYAGQLRSLGSNLPQVSTSSVDINTCDLSSPFAGSFGGGGGPGSGGSEPQAPPALPPGWTGVMCHGIYAGAIPPGGTVEAFWRGEYGFAGDAAQQAALLREGQWLLANGQIGP
jgi:hypothetical protein